MIDPEQAAFRSWLRSRIRPPAAVPDDDDWKPHPTWDFGGLTVVGDEPRHHGPPQKADPSPGLLAVRRYRERQRALKAKDPGRSQGPCCVTPDDA